MVKPVLIGRSNRYGSVKPKETLRCSVPTLRGQGERFAEPQEIVGLIGQADVAAGKAADAARQADGLFALLLELQKNVHGALLDVALDLGVLRLHRLEIIQLIQAQKAQLPQDCCGTCRLR